MSIIEHDDRLVKRSGECCSWHKGRELHHNHWLAQLQNLRACEVTALTNEVRAEAATPILMPWQNSFLDIADLARAHAEALPKRSIHFAEFLTTLIKAVNPPEITDEVLTLTVEEISL